MKRKTRRFLMTVCSLAVGLLSIFAVGCDSCSSGNVEETPPAVDKFTVFDVSSSEYAVGSDRTRILPEYLPEGTAGGKTGKYLKLKTVTSTAGGVDFMFKPAFEKAHYEALAAEKDNYVVTLEFYLDRTFQGEETDANGKVTGIYMWSSVFGINEGQYGYPQRDTGWYKYSIRLSEFIEQYETVEKLYTGRRTSGVTYSIIHTHSNIPTDYDFYIKDIMITEDADMPPEPDPATPEMIINPTDVTSPQFRVGESWKENLSSEDLTVVKSQVSEVNGKTGDFTKYNVTFLAKGNARFDVKFKKLPANDLDNYNRLVEENPNLQVKLYVYVDASNVFHPDHETNPEKANALKMVADMHSPMFGVDKFNGKDLYGSQYEFSKVISLSDWIAINYEGISFRNYAIFGAGFSDTLKEGSVLDLYLSIEIGEGLTEDGNTPTPPSSTPVDPDVVFDATYANSTTFFMVESWNNGISSTSDMTVVSQSVTEANGKTGTFVKHSVTFNKTGNAKFGLKMTGAAANSFATYQGLLTENPNLQVKLYMYVDASKVFHPDHETNPEKANSLKMTTVMESTMFGVASFDGASQYGSVYEYIKIISLSDWLANNFNDGTWLYKNIFAFGASDKFEEGSVLDVYLSIEIGDFRISVADSKILDTADNTKNIFKLSQVWTGITASDLAVVTEQASTANEKEGDYVKHTVTINAQGNGLFGIVSQAAMTYDEYLALATENPNLKVKLTVYIDASEVFHPDHETNANKAASLKMNSTVQSKMFGVTTNITGLTTSAYEYEKEITLAEWLEINYVDGVWQNKSVFTFGASDTIKAGSVLTCYIAISLVDGE